jgi:hypothetical protein
MKSGYLILHVRFISALTEIGLVHLSLCKKDTLCIWETTTHVTLWVSAQFRSRLMMADTHAAECEIHTRDV